MEASAPFFTWRSSHSGPLVASKLDRCLVSDTFVDNWVGISASILPKAHSDHHPLLLMGIESSVHAVKPFRFQNFWASHASFLEVV